MKVLAVTPYYRPEGGGLERYAHGILSGLVDRGHDVHALAFTAGEPGTETVDGVSVERVSPLFHLGTAPVHPGFPRRVSSRIRDRDPTVVVAHTPVPFPAEAAYLANRRHDVPFVVTFHAGRLRGSSRLLDALAALDRRTLQRRMLAGADALVAVSGHVRRTALRDHGDSVTVIPPGVDHGRFTPPSGGSRHDARVLYVGPLDSSYDWKGVDVLLDALSRVRDRHPDVELELVGDGDRTEAVAERADRAGLPVRIRGRVDDEALVEAYQRAAVTVLPSTSDVEPFGLVLAEANACGCPVVGSDVGGIPSFVHHGENGLLAEPGDAGDLADAILEILDDRDRARRMGSRGRRRVLRGHKWPRLVRRTEQVLVEVVQDETLLVDGPDVPPIRSTPDPSPAREPPGESRGFPR